MPKGNKGHKGASSSGGGRSSKKLIAQVRCDSPSSPKSSPIIEVDYDQMPSNHKKKFFIYDDCGSLYKYCAIINWLRFMGCFNGSVFHEIENLNWRKNSGHGYPLVEIEVITADDNSAKFIISKNDLYVIAFYCQKWLHFSECAYKVKGGEGFTILQNFKGSYSVDNKPWENVGPKEMINAVNLLATKKHNGDVSPFVRACEVFFVHLSEAARLYPVEFYICRTLTPLSFDGLFEKRTYEDEAKIFDNWVSEDGDIYTLVEAEGPIDFNITKETPEVIEHLIKNYGTLSKYWYLYSLTNKSLCEMDKSDVTRFQMKSIKSLRCTLAVLCNINLDKLLEEWVSKSTITKEVYKEMEGRVRDLQQQAKVRTTTARK